MAFLKERYSFSKLSSFHTCKYGYKMTYIDHLKGEGNCFSSYGTEVHSIMERYANGELQLWDLAPTFEWEFEAAIPEPFPVSSFCKDMKQLYYDQGLEFLKNFSGFPGMKVLGVEEKFEVEIDDWIFNGIIDLILQDEKTGDIIIQDYKSKSKFKNKQEQAEYARQLYLYSLHIYEKYGKFPKTLRFLMFRKNKPLDISFKENDYYEAIGWAKQTVDEIRNCKDFTPSCEEFYSENLCNHRGYCEKK